MSQFVSFDLQVSDSVNSTSERQRELRELGQLSFIQYDAVPLSSPTSLQQPTVHTSKLDSSISASAAGLFAIQPSNKHETAARRLQAEGEASGGSAASAECGGSAACSRLHEQKFNISYFIGEYLALVTEGQVIVQLNGTVIETRVQGECERLSPILVPLMDDLIGQLEGMLTLQIRLTTPPVCKLEIVPALSPPPLLVTSPSPLPPPAALPTAHPTPLQSPPQPATPIVATLQPIVTPPVASGGSPMGIVGAAVGVVLILACCLAYRCRKRKPPSPKAPEPEEAPAGRRSSLAVLADLSTGEMKWKLPDPVRLPAPTVEEPPKRRSSILGFGKDRDSVRLDAAGATIMPSETPLSEHAQLGRRLSSVLQNHVATITRVMSWGREGREEKMRGDRNEDWDGEDEDDIDAQRAKAKADRASRAMKRKSSVETMLGRWSGREVDEEDMDAVREKRKVDKEAAQQEALKKKGSNAWIRAVRNAKLFSHKLDPAPSVRQASADMSGADMSAAETFLEALRAQKNKPGLPQPQRLPGYNGSFDEDEWEDDGNGGLRRRPGLPGAARLPPPPGSFNDEEWEEDENGNLRRKPGLPSAQRLPGYKSDGGSESSEYETGVGRPDPSPARDVCG